MGWVAGIVSAYSDCLVLLGLIRAASSIVTA